MGIAKIAVCFARHSGIPLSPDSSICGAIRGERSINGIVSSVPEEVISDTADEDNSLEHVIAIHHCSDSGSLFAYVCLFQAFEFVVLLAENWNQDIPDMFYRYDLISCKSSSVEALWTATHKDICMWLESEQKTLNRQKHRSKSLIFWYNNIQQVWMKRAIAKGVDQVSQTLKKGGSKEEAETNAREVMNTYLAKYGLEFSSFEISEAPRNK